MSDREVPEKDFCSKLMIPIGLMFVLFVMRSPFQRKQ